MELAKAWEKELAHITEWRYLSYDQEAAITALVNGTELAELRAKLAAAEANGEQYRKNWKSLQDLTGEGCLDRARYAVKAWKEAAEQLAAAREREAGLLALVERYKTAIADVHELISESEGVAGPHLNGDVAKWSEIMAGGGPCEGWLKSLDGLLDLSPTAGLDELRRREREAALREAADVIESNAGNEQMTGAFAAKYLRDRADAIAAERDHIADVGKMAGKLEHCAADIDGECDHAGCPQLRDGEPEKTGRHCPMEARTRDGFAAELSGEGGTA